VTSLEPAAMTIEQGFDFVPVILKNRFDPELYLHRKKNRF